MKASRSTMAWLAMVGFSLATMGFAADAAALDGPEWEIKSGTKVVGKGDAENRTKGAGVWCKSPTQAYFFTKSSDYTKNVSIFRETPKGDGVEQAEIYVLRPNGDLMVTATGKKRAQIVQTVTNAGSTYKVAYRDDAGVLQGYAYWSPTSSGFYDAKDKKIGTFGSSLDKDMRMLTFFYFEALQRFC